ncbi:MAG: hypothetical protein AAGI28_04140 [Pseudomonadota bacterium]
MFDFGWIIVFTFVAVIVLMPILLGPNAFNRRVRKSALPIVPREEWTDAEYQEYSRRLNEESKQINGGLTWQAHCELQRMTDRAAQIANSLLQWRDQIRLLDEDAAKLEQQAKTALATGDESKARQFLKDRRALIPWRAALEKDIEVSETTLAGYRREITELESRLSDDMRREAIASARLNGARDTIRARQLMYGTLAEAKMAKLERKEQAADLAEAKVDALNFGKKVTLYDELEELELERDMEALRLK